MEHMVLIAMIEGFRRQSGTPYGACFIRQWQQPEGPGQRTGSMTPLLPWGCGASVGASIELGRKRDEPLN